uniref:Thiaminase-2/PQQC domain-containing protein n=1 Tax=Grammatophora oceanica TaxID=210454 RepID=A0A7S1Y2N7_9STRA|mmetsp:Transcript_14534/g.21405  ORF Transcript_14534/g.21405 Transcript_14534/m.21405 type:complete len:234 (+) Transcript_14534:120-821(+)|eukprot:CAMPEP_0194047670 /NCGR_PEP_ID=MMETSP0009_2-20130614/25105_1 /TAXON_ID=210454 /ORGANISM="Grammatophora oceanica, Strain CCMP 410" /LENGTH=233 /DNA_ID=CAMNT_0038693347 /DNA_START=120 /DNA_END=821 /DNA_ORIENTATION=-
MSNETPSVQSFWDDAKSIIEATEKHPFLVDMVKGTLDMDAFRYYVVQDALYLHDFADCLRRLGAKADDPESMERLKDFAKGAEEAELSLHNSFFQEWNIGAEGVDQMPHTLLYTSYMKRIVTTCSYAEGLACLLPCFWVYMHVGKVMLELRKGLVGDNAVERPPQFDAWIDMYGGEDFEKEVKEYIDICNRVLRDTSSETRREMQTHFDMCCKLEYMFWTQAAEKMQWPDIAV